jgi:hypothetical protein
MVYFQDGCTWEYGMRESFLNGWNFYSVMKLTVQYYIYHRV